MARTIVTKDLVFEAIEELLKNNEDPSIINVRKHIGGGSYSTIKLYIDEWLIQRKLLDNQVPVPDELTAKVKEFASSLWNFALTYDNKRLVQEREDMSQQIAQAKKDLDAAMQAITHLEGDIERLQQQITDAQTNAAAAQEKAAQYQAEARAAEARASELERQMAEQSSANEQRWVEVNGTMNDIRQMLSNNHSEK